MKVHVPSIPDEGMSFSFSKSEGWFRGILTERLSDITPDISSAVADVDLLRTGENVSLSGNIRVPIRPLCGRCGAPFTRDLEVPLLRHLVPYFGGPKAEKLTDEEEVELGAEDMEFSFYQNEEIDLSEILTEEVLLALPITFLCRESCEGLCPRCGANLNEGACRCDLSREASPFAVLKNYKL